MGHRATHLWKIVRKTVSRLEFQMSSFAANIANVFSAILMLNIINTFIQMVLHLFTVCLEWGASAVRSSVAPPYSQRTDSSFIYAINKCWLSWIVENKAAHNWNRRVCVASVGTRKRHGHHKRDHFNKYRKKSTTQTIAGWTHSSQGQLKIGTYWIRKRQLSNIWTIVIVVGFSACDNQTENIPKKEYASNWASWWSEADRKDGWKRKMPEPNS